MRVADDSREFGFEQPIQHADDRSLFVFGHRGLHWCQAANDATACAGSLRVMRTCIKEQQPALPDAVIRVAADTTDSVVPLRADPTA